MDEDAERSSLFQGAFPTRRAEAGDAGAAGAAAPEGAAEAEAEPAGAPAPQGGEEDDPARAALFSGASPSKPGQESDKAAESEPGSDEEPVALNLEDLDITTHDIDFETMDGARWSGSHARGRRRRPPGRGGADSPGPRRAEDLRKFQEDEVVRVALSQVRGRVGILH